MNVLLVSIQNLKGYLGRRRNYHLSEALRRTSDERKFK